MKKSAQPLIISYICIVMFMSLLSTTPSYAQKFDQDYLKWKAEQEAHDARLKPPHASTTQQHYLARPTLQSATGAKISLNQANLVQLQELSGVGIKKAEAIIAYRQKNGKFKSIEELQQVKGIGPALLAKNKARLAL